MAAHGDPPRQVIGFSYLAKMVKQLLSDATVRSKVTLWTFLTGFVGIAVDEMIHQSQCSTCEAGSTYTCQGHPGTSFGDYFFQETQGGTRLMRRSIKFEKGQVDSTQTTQQVWRQIGVSVSDPGNYW